MDKTIIKIIVLILASLTFVGCNNQDQGNHNRGMNNVHEDQLFGLSISKLASWKFITSEESRDRIRSTKLVDENIEKLVLLFASKPIVVMMKSRRHIPLPTIQITVNPNDSSPDVSAIDILLHLSRKGPNAFKGYSIVHPPEEIEIDGQKAAYMKAHYTGEFWGDNNLYPVSYETWIVPRQRYFFMISAVSSQSEDNKTQSEITSIIKSIKLK